MPSPSTIAMNDEYQEDLIAENQTLRQAKTAMVYSQPTTDTEKLQALTKIAQAADRFVSALKEFDESAYPSDDLTQETAESECELEDLLAKFASLYK